MSADYLKMAFRNMWKYKTQSLTGILGLAFAIACFVPALYWMRYETSYDSFYPDSESIYRIYTKEKESGKINSGASKIMEKKLHEQFPAIEASTAFMSGPEICRTEEMPHIQLKMHYSDSTYFTVLQPLHGWNGRGSHQTKIRISMPSRLTLGLLKHSN